MMNFIATRPPYLGDGLQDGFLTCAALGWLGRLARWAQLCWFMLVHTVYRHCCAAIWLFPELQTKATLPPPRLNSHRRRRPRAALVSAGCRCRWSVQLD